MALAPAAECKLFISTGLIELKKQYCFPRNKGPLEIQWFPRQ